MKRLLILLALLLAVGTASAATTQITLDDFESGNVNKWVEVQTGGGSFSATAVDPISGTYSGSFDDAASGSGDFPIYTLPLNETGGFVHELCGLIRPESTSSGMNYDLTLTNGVPADYLDVGAHRLALINFNQGNIRYYGSSFNNFATYTAGNTYSVCFANINTTSETYDIYVDGNLEVSGASFTASQSNITHFQVNGVGSSATGTFEVDNFTQNITSTAPPSNVSAVTLTAIDAYDSSSITTFNATLNGTTYTTTNGTIILPILDNTTSLYNITFEAADYWSNTSTNVNFSSGTHEGSLAQNIVTYACYELYTNNTLSCDESGYYPKGVGTFTDQVNVTGYHPVDVTYTLSAKSTGSANCPSGWVCPSPLNYTVVFAVGFYDHKLNITAEDYTGSPLSNFTIFYNSSSLTGNESDGGAGSVQLELFQNETYTIEIVENIPSGAERNNSIQSAVINVPASAPATTQYYQFNLTFPSLSVTVLDEETGSNIPGNTTLTFTSSNTSFEKTVVNGSTNFNSSNSIPSGSYSIRFEADGYADRVYNLTYNRTFPQSLTAYLVNASSPSTVFNIEDRETRNPVEGATVTVQRFINGSLTTVNVLESDITGRTSFDYLEDEEYRIQITHPDYVQRNFTLNPILFSSYTILLDPTTSVGETTGDYSGLSFVFSNTRFIEQATNNLTATVSNPTGSLVSYGFNVTVDGVQLASENGTNAYGSVLSASFAIGDVSYDEPLVLDYWYQKSDGIMHEFRLNYSIEQVTAYPNQTWTGNRDYADEIPLLERALVVVIVTATIAALAFTFGGLAGSAAVSMLMLGFFAFTGFVSGWLVAVPIIGLFFILVGRGSA